MCVGFISGCNPELCIFWKSNFLQYHTQRTKPFIKRTVEIHIYHDAFIVIIIRGEGRTSTSTLQRTRFFANALALPGSSQLFPTTAIWTASSRSLAVQLSFWPVVDSSWCLTWRIVVRWLRKNVNNDFTTIALYRHPSLERFNKVFTICLTFNWK